MPFSDTPLNREVFQRVRWEEPVRESAEKECQRYSGLFFSKAKDAEAANDKEAQEAFRVLGGITSMMLNADSREEPFPPMMVLSTGRSAALEDFTDDHFPDGSWGSNSASSRSRAERSSFWPSPSLVAVHAPDAPAAYLWHVALTKSMTKIEEESWHDQ